MAQDRATLATQRQSDWKSYVIYRMVSFSFTVNGHFNSTPLFDVDYLRNDKS